MAEDPWNWAESSKEHLGRAKTWTVYQRTYRFGHGERGDHRVLSGQRGCGPPPKWNAKMLTWQRGNWGQPWGRASRRYFLRDTSLCSPYRWQRLTLFRAAFQKMEVYMRMLVTLLNVKTGFSAPSLQPYTWSSLYQMDRLPFLLHLFPNSHFCPSDKLLASKWSHHSRVCFQRPKTIYLAATRKTTGRMTTMFHPLRLDLESRLPSATKENAGDLLQYLKLRSVLRNHPL